MTVETQVKKVVATGNDVATVFSFSPVVIFATSDIEVTKTDASNVDTVLSEGTTSTTYSVSTILATGSTGSITYPASGGTPLATGEKLTIKRVLTLEQTTDLENQGGYFADTQEVMNDRHTMVDLQQQDDIDRSIKVAVSDESGADFTMPAPVADTVIGIWNSGATAIVAGPTSSAISGAEGNATAAAASETAAAVSEAAAAASAVTAQAAADGIRWKDRALAATTADITLSGAQTVDGISLVAGDRCLVKDQSSTLENGMYVVAAGAWTRSTDMDTWDEVPSSAFAVEQGTANADTAHICTSDRGGTLETTAITFAVFGGGNMSTTTYDQAAIGEQVVGLTSSQSLSNKTLVTPIIASISNSGTITFPTGTDTLVGKATTDVLTNKTIVADNNTISNIDISNAIAASQAEAEAGTNNTKLVTPLRVAEAIAALASGGSTISRIATTSGGDAGITGISATAKLLHVKLGGVSADSAANWDLQIGDSGGYETAGYDYSKNGGVEEINSSGWDVDGEATAAVTDGSFWLSNPTGNQWNIYGHSSVRNGASSVAEDQISGEKTLTGTLDRIRLLSSGNFDAGMLTLTEYE